MSPGAASTFNPQIPHVPGKAASICPEILYRIFLALFYDKISWQTHSSRTQFPWNIAAVSRQWRATSLSSPKLWTRILATDAWHDCIIVDNICIHHLPIIRCYLQIERAQSMALIVDTKGIGCAVSLSVIRLAVMERSQQVSAFRVVSNEQLREQNIAKLVPSRAQLSALEFLDYQPEAAHEEGVSIAWESLVASASCLKALKIIGQWNGLTEFRASAGWWGRLRHVWLQDYGGSFVQLRRVLEKCPGLVTLHMSSYTMPGTDQDLPDIGERFPLNNLARVEIEHLSPAPMGALDNCHPLTFVFPCIHTPNLTDLVITDEELEPVHQDSFRAIMNDFSARCGSSIHSLELSMWREDLGTPEFLYKLVSLRQLVIKGRGKCSDSFLQSMYDGRDSPGNVILFPRLQHLRILNAHFDPVLLVHLIKRRHRQSRHPNRVEIQTSPFPALRRSIEKATLASLASCTLDPSFVITFDPAEFIDPFNNRVQWPFDE